MNAAFFERPCPSEHNLSETTWTWTRCQREYEGIPWEYLERSLFVSARLKDVERCWKVHRLSLRQISHHKTSKTSKISKTSKTSWYPMVSDGIPVFGVTLGHPPIAQIGHTLRSDGIQGLLDLLLSGLGASHFLFSCSPVLQCYVQWICCVWASICCLFTLYSRLFLHAGQHVVWATTALLHVTVSL